MQCNCHAQNNEEGGAAEAEEPAEAAPVYAPKKQMRSEDPEFQNQQKERCVSSSLGQALRIRLSCRGPLLLDNAFGLNCDIANQL